MKLLKELIYKLNVIGSLLADINYNLEYIKNKIDYIDNRNKKGGSEKD